MLRGKLARHAERGNPSILRCVVVAAREGDESTIDCEPHLVVSRGVRSQLGRKVAIIIFRRLFHPIEHANLPDRDERVAQPEDRVGDHILRGVAGFLGLAEPLARELLRVIRALAQLAFAEEADAEGHGGDGRDAARDHGEACVAAAAGVAFRAVVLCGAGGVAFCERAHADGHLHCAGEPARGIAIDAIGDVFTQQIVGHVALPAGRERAGEITHDDLIQHHAQRIHVSLHGVRFARELFRRRVEPRTAAAAFTLQCIHGETGGRRAATRSRVTAEKPAAESHRHENAERAQAFFAAPAT